MQSLGILEIKRTWLHWCELVEKKLGDKIPKSSPSLGTQFLHQWQELCYMVNVITTKRKDWSNEHAVNDCFLGSLSENGIIKCHLLHYHFPKEFLNFIWCFRQSFTIKKSLLRGRRVLHLLLQIGRDLTPKRHNLPPWITSIFCKWGATNSLSIKIYHLLKYK